MLHKKSFLLITIFFYFKITNTVEAFTKYVERQRMVNAVYRTAGWLVGGQEGELACLRFMFNQIHFDLRGKSKKNKEAKQQKNMTLLF